jgi:hypothetical protein
MPSLFEATTLQTTRSRLGALGAASPRQWGKMTAAQAVAHSGSWLARHDVPRCPNRGRASR